MLVHGEAASILPRELRPADRGGADRDTFTIGARPDSTRWCNQVLTSGVDQRQTQRHCLRLQLRSIASKLRQSEVEREIGNNQKLKVDGGVGGDETSNVEAEAGCERRMINWGNDKHRGRDREGVEGAGRGQ
jgi:hypothetical protein